MNYTKSILELLKALQNLFKTNKMKTHYLKVRSRHPSHNILRKPNVIHPERKGVKVMAPAVVRLGSTTKVSSKLIQINTIEAIKTSSNKLLMKKAFKKGGINSPKYWEDKDSLLLEKKIPFPLVAKKIYGSRGNGIVKIKNKKELTEFLTNSYNSSYYFEKYYRYLREYRIHVSEMGCFYTCRKMLKTNTPEHLKFVRNNNNCVWFLQSNPKFNQPKNWSEITEECRRALLAVGLDVGACDVRISATPDEEGNNYFKIIEINSAPSFGEKTAEKYMEILPKIVNLKYLIKQVKKHVPDE